MAIKINLISLGCAKNLLDSEHMLGIIEQNGLEITLNEQDADVIIVNTCGFIESARQEAINTILEVAEHKKKNLKALIVTGCMAQRYPNEILESIPEVDYVAGVFDFDKIVEVIHKALDGQRSVQNSGFRNIIKEDLPRVQTTPFYFAYLKIAEGCSNKCSYCAIPSIRGPYVSKPFDLCIEEAKRLIRDGVREIILIAQDTTRYLMDECGSPQLSRLIDEIAKIDGIEWIRVHYMYPEMIDDTLLKSFENKKVLKYFDIPFQHINDRILTLMNRRSNKEQIKDLIKKIRLKFPDAVIRTSLISGFPSETDEEFNELLDFVKTSQFERLGAFSYSKEEQTGAFLMKNHIPSAVKKKRHQHLVKAQNENIKIHNEKNIGKCFDVLVEGLDTNNQLYFGRTYMDSPEVDPLVYFDADEELEFSEIVKVKITGANEVDLIGKKFKKEAQIMNTANKITISRIVLVPVFLFFLTGMGTDTYRIIAAVMFILISITDGIDGYVARKYNQITNFGKFLDPLADKILITSALVVLVDLHLLNSIIAIIIIAREFIVTSLRLAASNKSAVISASMWGKFKTVFQIIAVVAIIIRPYFAMFIGDTIIDIAIIILIFVMLAITLYSGFDYIRKNMKYINYKE